MLQKWHWAMKYRGVWHDLHWVANAAVQPAHKSAANDNLPLLPICMSWTIVGQPGDIIFICSVAGISRHWALSEERIRQCWTSSGSCRKDTDKSPFPSTGTAVSLFRAESRDCCCWGRPKPGCRIVGSHTRWELTTWANFQLCLHDFWCQLVASPVTACQSQ